MSKVLVTSALPYINGVPHLGHMVGCLLPSDIYARFMRMMGNEVLHIGGTDEHGTTSEVGALKAGMGVEEYCDMCGQCREKSVSYMLDEVRNAAYEIINKKGATFYAIALAVERIVTAIVNDEHSILTVSSVLEGDYGLSDVCLSVPTVVGGDGIVRVIETPLNEEEKEGLQKSAQTLSEILRELGF